MIKSQALLDSLGLLENDLVSYIHYINEYFGTTQTSVLL